MEKLKIRNCTRCKKGEVFLDRDQYGWYESCLQCGYTRDLPDIVKPVANEWKNWGKDGLPERKVRSLIITKGV